jgi:hypothetical protein
MVTRRMASRLLPAGQAEDAAGAVSEPSPVVQAATDKGEDLAAKAAADEVHLHADYNQNYVCTSVLLRSL